MKRIFNRCISAFLSLAFLIGTIDVSMMTRKDFYQPPVPEQLLKR